MYTENSEGVPQNSTTADPSPQSRRSFLAALVALGSVFVRCPAFRTFNSLRDFSTDPPNH